MKWSRPLVLFIFLLLSCHDNYQELRGDIYIQRYFDRNQSKDLAKILEFFDEAVCRTTGRTSIMGRVCYNDWFAMIDTNSQMPPPLQLTRAEQWEFSSRLYQETTEALWTIKEPSPDGKYTDLPHLLINRSGPYLKWLKLMAADDPAVREYYSLVINKGYSSPECQRFLIHNMTEWPIGDPRYRLIIALHLLTQRSQHPNIQ